jgi:TonB family protein
MMKEKLVVFCTLLLALSVPMAGSATIDAYEPVRLTSPLEATIPIELKYLAIPNPEVHFRVLVDAEGKITDYLAIEGTHVGLLPKAEDRLQRAQFKPARLNGEAASGKITVIVTFFDPEQRAWKQGGQAAPFGGNVSDAAERRIYSNNPQAYVLAESDPEKLDSPPRLLESKLYRLHAPDEAPKTGNVVVEYYIDHNGKVRLPKIISSDDRYLSLSALMSLRETRFHPPRRNGRPTFVHVRQPFHF